jgi:hypothetical protein
VGGNCNCLIAVSVSCVMHLPMCLHHKRIVPTLQLLLGGPVSCWQRTLCMPGLPNTNLCWCSKRMSLLSAVGVAAGCPPRPQCWQHRSCGQ